MIECAGCHTLNPDAERNCLVCGTALAAPARTGISDAAVTRCAAGHPIDPSWKSCPYCDRLAAGEGGGGAPHRGATRLEAPTAPGVDSRTRLEAESPWPPPAPPPVGSPRPTRLEEPGSTPGGSPGNPGRRTVLQESATAAGALSSVPPAPEPSGNPRPAAGAPQRKLVGVLAAPGLGSGGTVFPVRAGKNAIGADRSNDIVLGADGEVSREHAVLLHRNGGFHLADRFSTNGTAVNGQELPANGTVQIWDRDRIRCGKTDLLFLVIDAGEAIASPPAASGADSADIADDSD